MDLAATKAEVVQARAATKDYLDIDALIDRAGIPLSDVLGAAGAVFGSAFNPVLTLKALCFFADGDLATLPQHVCRRMVDAASAVDPTKHAEIRAFGRRCERRAPDEPVEPSAELLRVAKRMVWFKPPEETLADPVLFLSHVMTHGTVEDLQVMRGHFTDEQLWQVQRAGLPGVFDAQSKAYWRGSTRHPASTAPANEALAGRGRCAVHVALTVDWFTDAASAWNVLSRALFQVERWWFTIHRRGGSATGVALVAW